MNSKTHSVSSLFPQVFANGYVPIPNWDKKCELYGWSRVNVDDRQVDLWSRSLRWPAMGLRVEPPLLVIDNDTLDPELAALIDSFMPAGAMRRVGKAPKAAYFLRLKGGEPFYRISTRRWAPTAKAKKPLWSAVEIFGGGGGAKQFGVFGPHAHDKAGNVVSEYSWGDRSPANTPIGELPSLSVNQCHGIINAAEGFYRDAGWEVDRFTRGGMTTTHQVYDLTDEMIFEMGPALTPVSLAELEDETRVVKVKGGPRVKVTGSFTKDPHSLNSLRGLVSISHHDRVCIVDTKTYLTHHPKELAGRKNVDLDLAPDVAGMQALLKMIEGK